LLSDGKVLITGGSDWDDFSFTLASAELYDPDTGAWSRAGSLNTGRVFHTTTLLPDGKVLAAGGYSPSWQVPSFAAPSAELYDPASRTWNLTGQLNTARSEHTATLLPGGNVLVAGGATATTELWDASTGEWSSMPSIATTRRAHTATLLFNRDVLIVGGAIQNDSLDSAEVFDFGLPPSEPSAGVGTRLLIPSSVYSDESVSSLAILNVDSEPNNITIQASNQVGHSIGSMTMTLRLGERFQTANILQRLGATPGSSGPILVSSNNGRLLSAVSEVRSSKGGGGTFTAVNLEDAWTEGFLLEAIDSGPRGCLGLTALT
jgi:WD40 repeat protein